jgi:hypothetical protein
MTNLWGIPVEVRESVVLELGDRVCDGGQQYEVLSVNAARAITRRDDRRAARTYPRELALDRAGVFVMRPPMVRPTAIVGAATRDELRKISNGR